MTQDKEESRKIYGRKVCQGLTAHKLPTQTRIDQAPINPAFYNAIILNLLYCLHVGLEEFSI